MKGELKKTKYFQSDVGRGLDSSLQLTVRPVTPPAGVQSVRRGCVSRQATSQLMLDVMRTQQSTGFLLLVCLFLHSFFSIPCRAARPVTPELYVAEFLTQEKSQIAPDGWSPQEQVISDKQLFSKLRMQSSKLLAVGILNAGIHPRWTMVFLEDEDDVRVVATLTFWGRIQMKRVGQIPRAEYAIMLQELLRSLKCASQMESDFMMRGFVHWNSGKATFCDANPWQDDGAKLSQVLGPVLQATEVRFTVWEHEE